MITNSPDQKQCTTHSDIVLFVFIEQPVRIILETNGVVALLGTNTHSLGPQHMPVVFRPKFLPPLSGSMGRL